jgi:RNA polymerase sigma-70 factor (ECF subfamily)
VHFLLAYLYRTASNLAKNRIKQRMQRRRDDELVFFETEDERSPERLCSDRAEIALIRQALSQLPAKCREAFRLVKIDGLSSDEVGQRLNMHPRRVRRYVARALAHCLAVLEATEIAKGKDA